MDEYFGSAGEKYLLLTRGKQHLLMPAISRHCTSVENQDPFLDIACGAGDCSKIAIDKGYSYVGIDASKTMLERARNNNPDGEYILGSAMHLSKHFAPKDFKIALMSMFLPALTSREDMVKVLKETHTVLAEDGILLLGVTHPSFDWYMQDGLIEKKNITSEFKGYFSSGEQFIIHKEGFDSHDIHWTLEDYAGVLQKAGFVIRTIDECPPSIDAGADFVAERSRFPTYMLIVGQKLK